MKRIVIIGCAAGAAVVILLIWLQSGAVSRGHRQPVTNELSVENPPTPAHPLARSQAAESVVARLAGSSTNSSTPRHLTLADVEALLQREAPLHPREIPALEEEVEAQLCERYARTTLIADKYGILKVLALGGSSKCVPLFTNAVYGEFAGRRVDAEENAKLLHIPVLLGFLAHREPSAIEALHDMAGAVTADHLWHHGTSFPVADTIRVRALEGLGASGRPEVKAWLESCRALPASATTFPRGVVEAAFNYWLVETLGFDESVADHQDNPQKLLMAAHTWLGSPEGKAWLVWDKSFNPGP